VNAEGRQHDAVKPHRALRGRPMWQPRRRVGHRWCKPAALERWAGRRGRENVGDPPTLALSPAGAVAGPAWGDLPRPVSASGGGRGHNRACANGRGSAAALVLGSRWPLQRHRAAELDGHRDGDPWVLAARPSCRRVETKPPRLLLSKRAARSWRC